MFKVVIVAPHGYVSEEFVESVLPTGYEAEATETDLFKILTASFGLAVGFVRLIPRGKVEVSADEGTPLGHLFWQAFAMKHPQISPLKIGYGIVYLFDDGQSQRKFQLDKRPVFLREEAFSQAQEYAKCEEAYLVSFYMGDYHSFESLKTISCQRIHPSGELENDLGKRDFVLGSVENDRTM